MIVLNMVAMALDMEPQQPTGTINNNGEFVPDTQPAIKYVLLSQVLEYINMGFTFIFVIEAIIKIIGLRGHYFRRAWNVFDFVVVTISVVGILLDELLVGQFIISPTLLRVVRVFRIGRILRLVKSAKGIRKLLFALIISIPALFNIATLLFLFMFIFAIMGMTFFGNVRHSGELTEIVNFETFSSSMLLLFRLCTSGGWNDVLYPLMDEGNCNHTHYTDTLGIPQEAARGDCGSSALAVAFFLAYLFLNFMVIINMYIAVILENFSQAHEQEEIGITEDDFDEFYVIWEKYDPHATQYIKFEDLSEFIATLDPPLGIPKPNSMALVSFNLPIVECDRIHCLDIMMALVTRVLRSQDEETHDMSEEHRSAHDKLKQQVDETFRKEFPQRAKGKIVSTTIQRKKEDVAAKTLQRAWRKHKMKKNILRIKELAALTAQEEERSRSAMGLFESFRTRVNSTFSNALEALSRRTSIRSTKSTDSCYSHTKPAT